MKNKITSQCNGDDWHVSMFLLLETLFMCPVVIPSLYPTEDMALWSTMSHRIKLNITAILCKGGI